MEPPCGRKGSLNLRDPSMGSTLAYDRTVSVCRPGLTAPRAGLIPLEVIGPMARCACASLFVMMSGSVIFPQMRHSHPSYSQAWPPSKCLAILNPPHRSQVMASSIGHSEHVCVTTGVRPPPDDPVHLNSVPASPHREGRHSHRMSPHRDDPGEQHQDDQGNDRVHRKSLRHLATGCVAGALGDNLTESQRMISGP
jgi:hypothetical protein